MDMIGRAGSKCNGPALPYRVKLLRLLDFIRKMCYSTTVILTIHWTFLPATRRTNNYVMNGVAMARRRTNDAKIDPALFHRGASSVTLSEDVITAYLSILREEGRTGQSLRLCETVLRQFLAFLPDGVITKDSLPAWREHLLSEGFAIRTVNCRVSTVSALLEAMDCREFQVDRQLRPPQFEAPELTRQEYLRMLQTAKLLEDRRGYALAKLFATTGLSVSDLPLVTVEAAQAGRLVKGREIVRFSEGLQADLLDYAKQNGRSSGTIFTQKNGSPLMRTQVGVYIQKLGQDAQIPAEKANIRALRHLHKAAVAAIEANFDLLVQQAYERQLEREEVEAGW